MGNTIRLSSENNLYFIKRSKNYLVINLFSFTNSKMNFTEIDPF